MFADGELDIFCFAKFDICSRCEHSICCASRNERRFAPRRVLFSRLRSKHIERVSAISNAKRISSGASAAHIDVEPTCETHDGLDMPCHREQVERIYDVRVISKLLKQNDITCQCFRVA